MLPSQDKRPPISALSPENALVASRTSPDRSIFIEYRACRGTSGGDGKGAGGETEGSGTGGSMCEA